MCICVVPRAAMKYWPNVSWQAGFGAPEAGWRHHSGGELVELHPHGCCWGAVQSKVMLDRWLGRLPERLLLGVNNPRP